ncbi:MAG TPA: metallophosphoesterase [Nakamurella sp.]
MTRLASAGSGHPERLTEAAHRRDGTVHCISVGRVRLSFVSDIHGNIAGLADVARAAEQLVVLGDLLDYVDYHDPSAAILGRVFGADKVRRFIELRLAGDFPRLREYNASLWESVCDPVGTLHDVVAARYREVVAAVGPDALLTLGNVDVASVWNDVAGDELPYLDAETVEIAGRRLGFVAGGSGRPGVRVRPTSSVWQPLIRSAEEFTAAVKAVGPVDILCSHVPPGIARLRYDVVPGRLEMYGPGLLESIDEHHPALAVFGHVHQPISRRTRRGHTECVNVGHFQRFPQPFDVDLS